MRMRVLLVALLVPAMSMAAEGMWTLDNLPKAKMQAEYGFTPSEAWIKRAMLGSVRIAGGCSASFVSKDGLVMTNHHCASECLEQLSTAKKNLIKDGFLAKRREEELSCPEIELNRLEQITDVTAQVKSATTGLDGEAFKKAQNAIKAKLSSACVGNDKETVRCDVVDLYHGGQYEVYKYHRFQDTRLVWAPEKAAAFFGGDPDNFNFPRYDLDIAVLRAYEGGKPAKIESYFPFSKNGAAAGEMVFVTGQPGSTQRQLTVAQLTTLRDVTLVNSVISLSELRGVLEQYSKTSPEAARTAEHMLFGVENGFKVRRGQLTALLDPALMKQKQDDETALRHYVAQNPALQAKVGGAWDAIAAAQQTYRQIEAPFGMIEWGRGFNSKYASYARTLVRGAEERAKPNGERLPEYADAKLPEVEQDLFSTAPVYPEFEKVTLGLSLTKMREMLGTDDAFVKQVLGKQSPDQLSAALVDHTTLGDPAVRKALWQGGKEAILKSNDPFIKLELAIDPAARAIRTRYEKEVESVQQKNSELIAQARFSQQGTSAYPDATFTLRMSYGEVKGWKEGDRQIPPFTTIGGAFARDTGADPFALPASWHAARNKLNVEQHYDLVSTNDIIGGNSGSPMINRNGEIVGLIFDGNIHSLGGAFWYDPVLNRAVAVDSGAILETLDKVYGGSELKKEMLGQ
ncbi:S46 family peptidase [Glaciimonas soli]|uniref:Dipeptidyl-peptidase n=1 Tax=Glaciimonas soli TaxID=2590999 RepID=A0A843YWP4_9BURK|nr:S46 family peptidase [Glaciimonas soli]MQR02407.1 S46 family peptidase [Glaciimonas soli]